MAGFGAAVDAAKNIINNKTVGKSLGVAAKTIGDEVLSGVANNSRGMVRRAGERVVKSNMTKEQIKKMGKKGFEAEVKNVSNLLVSVASTEGMQNAVNKAVGAATKKGLGADKTKAIAENVINRQMAKNSTAFKLGDAVAGGVRDAMRSRKAGHDIKTALQAGFTRKVGGEWQQVGNVMKKVGGERQIRMDRVAGAAFGAGLAGRAISGGGLFRDRYGRVNVPGVPFI